MEELLPPLKKRQILPRQMLPSQKQQSHVNQNATSQGAALKQCLLMRVVLNGTGPLRVALLLTILQMSSTDFLLSSIRGEVTLTLSGSSALKLARCLHSFIRLQAQYDPGVSEDLILGAVERDFAVGLDAFQLKLDNSRGQFKLGKIENAGSVFIADGFTRRGAESLDARSALGVSYQTRIGGIDAVGSISDGNNTVSGSRANLPNFGLGVRKKFAHSAHHLGWLL